MRVFFTGIFPLWAVIVTGAAIIALTLFLYRRENLSRPWSIILPAIRCCVLVLLFVILMQPILAWMHTSETSGKIPVILDNSGSMRVRDKLSPSKTVRYAETLGVISAEERQSVFAETRPSLKTISRELRAILSQAESPDDAISEDMPPSPSSIEKLTETADRLEKVVSNLEETEEKLRSKTEACEYLNAERAESVASSAPEDANVLYERYEGLPGWQTESLTTSDKYPATPDTIRILSRFRAPKNIAERYGARMRAVLTPPHSGLYRFFFSSDDQGKLRLAEQTGDDSKSLIAEAPEWVPSPGDFTKHDEQKSQKIRLQKGKRYLLEAVFKENQGTDHCVVNWVPPDRQKATPIPGQHLQAWPEPASYEAFRKRYKKLLEAFETLKEQIKTAVNQMQQANDGEKPATAAIRESLEHLNTAAGNSTAVIADLSELQRYADAVLRSTPTPAVSSAFQRVKNMSRLEKLVTSLQSTLCSEASNDLRKNLAFFPLQTPLTPLNSFPETAEELQPYLDESRLGDALGSIRGFYKDTPVSGVILCTDGNPTGGSPLRETTRRLRDTSIPVYTLGMGTTAPPPDVRIENLSGPDSSFRGDRVTLEAVIERPGFERTDLEMQVHRKDTLVASKEIPRGSSSTLTRRIQFPEKKGGSQRYTVKIAPKDGEVLTRNNSRSITVDILTTPAKGLFIEQFPRWESRHIDRMFNNDPRLVLDSIILPPHEAPKKAEANKRLTQAFQHLSRYDVVVLGDVHPDTFTASQYEKLLTYVRERGRTLIYLAGSHYMPFAYKNEDFKKLLPINLKRSKSSAADGTTETKGMQEPIDSLQLTQAGKADIAVRLASTTAMTGKLWENLPAPYVIHPEIVPTETAQVLISAQRDDTPREIPLIMQTYQGKGSVAFINSDSFWRWRRLAGEEYHYRLWGQIMLWATTGTATTNGPFVTFLSHRRRYTPDEPVYISVRVRDRQGRLSDKESISAGLKTIAAEKAETTITLQPVSDQKGIYQTRLDNLPEGRYAVHPRLDNISKDRLEAVYRFRVERLQSSEYLNLAMAERKLKRASTEFYTLDEASEICNQIPDVQIERTRRYEYQIWNSFWLILIAGILLGIEWQTRKTLMRI